MIQEPLGEQSKRVQVMRVGKAAEGIKTTSVKMDSQLWWKAKMYAFKHGMQLSELLAEALKQYFQLQTEPFGKLGIEIGSSEMGRRVNPRK